MAEAVRRSSFLRLLLSHLDAWQVALAIASLALFLHDAFSRRTAVLLLAVTVGYWLAFTINDYFDAPYDARDPRKAGRNFFTQYRLPRAVAAPALLLVAAGMIYAFGQFGARGLFLLALCTFVMIGYSAPPFRFKDRPGLDLLVHAVFVETLPYLMVLILIDATWTTIDLAILTITFLASLTAQLEQQLRDYRVDTDTARTFTTLVGYGPARGLLQALTILLLLFGAAHIVAGTFPPVLIPIGLIAAPAMFHRLIRKPTAQRSERLVILSTTIGFLYVLGLFVYFVLRV